MSTSGGTSMGFVTSCPTGSVVVSGGWNGSANLRLFEDRPMGNAWRIGLFNPGTTTESATGYVVCQPVSGGGA
ncbi:hypothetical protein [Streptomyces sp. NPDC002644]